MEHKHYIVLTLIWTVLITVLSLVSFNAKVIVTAEGADKLVHFSFYFILTLLFLRSFKKDVKCKYLIVMVLAFFYGIIIEVLQENFTFTRKGDFYDVMANLTGIVFAVMLNKLIIERISFRKI